MSIRPERIVPFSLVLIFALIDGSIAIATKHPRIIFNNDGIPLQYRLSSAEVSEITEVIQSVDNLMEGRLEVPDKIHLEISKQPSDGRDHFEKDSFTIVMSWSNPNLISKKGTLAHEYAHGILHRSSEKHHVFHNEISDMKHQQEQIALAEKAGEITRTESNYRWADLTGRMLNASLHFDRYHELFADTVAVMVTGNPSAISKAISEDLKGTNAEHKAHLRDFSLVHLASPLLLEDSHLYFSPVRSQLGSAGIGNFNLTTNRRLLKDLFENIGTEMSDRLGQDPDRMLTVVDVTNENARVGKNLIVSIGTSIRETPAISSCTKVLDKVSFPSRVEDLAQRQQHLTQDKIRQLMHSSSPIEVFRRARGN